MNVSEMESLIEQHGTPIYRFCHKLAMTKPDTDDLYQQTFLKALEMQDQIHLDQNPKSFLMGLAISIWKNNVRKYARRQRIVPTVSMDEREYLSISSELNLEDMTLTNELHTVIRQITQELHEKFRIPIILYYTEELSIEQIAKILRVPQGTIKSRLYKGRLLIKKGLEAKGYGEYA